MPTAAPDPSAYRLPAIPYLRLRITLRALRPGRLPSFKGSLLRGAFGHALRRSVCAFGPQAPCPACALRRACPYPRIFEALVEAGEEPPPFLRGLPSGPRPYVFEPATEARDFRPGDPLPFDLLLFGQAIELQAYALLAVQRMAAGGLGRERIPFLLDRALGREPGGAWRELAAAGRLRPGAALAPSLPPAEPLPEEPLELCLRTATRLKSGGHLTDTLTFRALVFAMLRRTLELAHFHVPGAALDWTFRPLLDRASRVEVASSHLTWHDWQRYSNRQQTEMTLGGLVGTLTLRGDLAPFAPLLRAAEIVHVGKGTVFGLGKIEVGAGGARELQ